MEENINNVIVKEGIIYQSVSGFYYVWSEGESYTTKPKGLFRHHQEKPLVGDRVEFEVNLSDELSENRLITILPRDNQLIRPSVANVDYAWVVMSLTEPDFSYNLMDAFLVSVESKKIEPMLVLTKYDLLIEQKGLKEAEAITEEIRNLYASIGYSVFVINGSDESYQQISNSIDEGIYVVMGQSGVGKSTLLNHLLPEADIETSPISDSLNRGRHTTREVTLYPLNNGLLADTPGFSSIEFTDIEKEQLQYYFPEIADASQYCKFRSCVHINEPKCHVKQLVEEGTISEIRYQNYQQIYNNIENQKPLYNKKDK